MLTRQGAVPRRIDQLDDATRLSNGVGVCQPALDTIQREHQRKKNQGSKQRREIHGSHVPDPDFRPDDEDSHAILPHPGSLPNPHRVRHAPVCHDAIRGSCRDSTS
jgi:hypothetical protein